ELRLRELPAIALDADPIVGDDPAELVAIAGLLRIGPILFELLQRCRGALALCRQPCVSEGQSRDPQGEQCSNDSLHHGSLRRIASANYGNSCLVYTSLVTEEEIVHGVVPIAGSGLPPEPAPLGPRGRGPGGVSGVQRRAVKTTGDGAN